jgi:hypothetical protein
MKDKLGQSSKHAAESLEGGSGRDRNKAGKDTNVRAGGDSGPSGPAGKACARKAKCSCRRDVVPVQGGRRRAGGR